MVEGAIMMSSIAVILYRNNSFDGCTMHESCIVQATNELFRTSYDYGCWFLVSVLSPI